MPHFDSLTPVKIRSKRSAVPAERWLSGKRRNARLKGRKRSRRADNEEAIASSSEMSASQRKLRKHRRELSPLEALPTEIVQTIFVLSGNPHLALSSPDLSKLLSNQHLCDKIAIRVLSPVLSTEEQDPTAADLEDATRFLDTRFASWNWFQLWLQREAYDHTADGQQCPSEIEIWAGLKPSGNFMPPKKLLRGPFTSDRMDFLELFTVSATSFPQNPYYTQLAYKGLVEAIRESSGRAVDLLLRLGLRSNTEHLRQAVIDDGCNVVIVELLIKNHRTSNIDTSDHGDTDLDLLDPELWAWIDRTKASGHTKGQWLMDLLRAAHGSLTV